jgi:Methyltransferase domain
MAVSTSIKDAINRVLNLGNLHLDTLSARKAETARIEALRDCGQFEQVAFPLLPGMAKFQPAALIATYEVCRYDVARFVRGGASPGHYRPDNDFYCSPDAEILYLMVRGRRPRRVVEIGSGHSTRIVRQAITDAGLEVEHTAIDPQPRDDIRDLVGRLHQARLEDGSTAGMLADLRAGDILFIDSSHEVRIANDCAKLFCNVLPALSTGVIVHVHDVFLPFDYPENFAFRFPSWGEQYILQAYLSGHPHELLWPGAWVQRMQPEVATHLPFLRNGVAQSFWFETR